MQTDKIVSNNKNLKNTLHTNSRTFQSPKQKANRKSTQNHLARYAERSCEKSARLPKTAEDKHANKRRNNEKNRHAEGGRNEKKCDRGGKAEKEPL